MVRWILLTLTLSSVMGIPTYANAAKTTKSVELRLNGVIVSTNSRAALINGKPTRVGEQIEGIEVLAIDSWRVQVLSGSEEYTLRIGGKAYLTPSVARTARQESVKSDPADPIRRVRHGDTLSGIALEYASSSHSLDQVISAIFDANPHAFNGNVDKLWAGAELKIPATFNNPPPPQQRLAAGDSQYGPVTYGETLSEIAVQLAGDGVSMHRMMMALYDANPDAFGASIDVLRQGAVLKIPTVPVHRPETAFAAKL